MRYSRTGAAAALAIIVAACGGGEQNPAAADPDVDMAMDGHEHEDVHEVDASGAPTIALEAVPDMAGVNLHIATSNFEWAPERASTSHRDGEGHAHVYVDGEKRGRVYGEWIHVGLPAGAHTLMVDLNGNDHAAYAVGGEKIAQTVEIAVPEAAAHEHEDQPTHEIEGASVDVEVVADPMKGWNVFVETDGFTFTPEDVNGQHADGEGHAHLYVDGQKMARLYGGAFHLPDPGPGTHEVTVALYGNDHGPYVQDGEPVAATTTIEVEGEQAEPDVSLTYAVDGEEVDGHSAPRVPAGSVVEISVETTSADTLHVHGYDVYGTVTEGTATVRFTAAIPGVFELELEESGTKLADITVE